MHPNKIVKLVPGSKFRLTKDGTVFRVVKMEERDGDLMLSFYSVLPAVDGRRLVGTINLKLITKLHTDI